MDVFRDTALNQIKTPTGTKIMTKNVSLEGKKRGRPSRQDSEKIRTIAWYNAVRHGLGKDNPIEIARHITQQADANGLDGEFKKSKRWNKYARGDDSPSVQTLKFVNDIVPESAYIFENGPFDLWLSIWGENHLQLNEEDVEILCQVKPPTLDFSWLKSAVSVWRCRAFHAQFGTLNKFPDGLYEAILFGLNQPKIKEVLDLFGVFELIRAEFFAIEKENIFKDRTKLAEIITLGKCFLKDNNPVYSYLSDPIGFNERLSMDACSHQI